MIRAFPVRAEGQRMAPDKGKWLGNLDSNQDRQSQNLLSYR